MGVRRTDPEIRFRWPVALGFSALCIAVNWPGRLNADSLFAILAAEIPGAANNWHSATLGWLWSLPAPALGQPAGALMVQALLFGGFAGFLPRLARTPRGCAALALELVFRVALVGAFGFVGKDATALGLLLVGVQLVRRGLTGTTRPALALLALFFLLIKAPHFLTLVVAVALVLPFFTRSAKRWAALVVAALLLGSLAIPLNRVVDAHLFHARDVHPDKQLVIFDLAAISLATGEDRFAAVPGWPRDLPPLRDCVLPYMWDAFAPWGPCRGYSAAYDAHDAALTRAWAAAILGHPIAYLRHRLTYAGYLLTSRDHAGWGLGGGAINTAGSAELKALATGLHAARPVALWRPDAATAPFAAVEAALFRFPKVQWFALLASLAILLGSWLRRREGVRIGAIVPAALGVGNVAMLMAFGVADPGRYLLPSVALAYAALLALLAPASDQSAA